jgi:hypothetical protein
MDTILVLTLSDIFALSFGAVLATILGIFGIAKLWCSARCKHDGGVHETMACDAICRKCGKNLGFIGSLNSTSERK